MAFPTTGLKLHLDADAITGLNDNDTVSQWDDLSGEGHHAIQPDTNDQPVLKTHVLNSQSVVSFYDNRWLYTDGWAGITGSQNRTVIAVLATTASDGGVSHWVDWGGNDNGERYSCRIHTGDGEVRVEVQGGFAFGNTIINDGEFNLVTLVLDGSDVIQHQIYVNGADDGKGDESSQSINTSSANDLRVGKAVTVTDRFFDGEIAELLIYDRALSTSEREDIETYLSNKWLADWTTVSDPTASEYADSGLDPDTTYEVRVAGENMAGQSEWSTIVEFTTSEATTSVETERGLVWDVSAIVASERELRWDALVPLLVDRNLRWDVRTAVPIDRLLVWSVFDQVESDRELRWNVDGTVASDRIVSWNISGNVSSVRVLRWGIEEPPLPPEPKLLLLNDDHDLVAVIDDFVELRWSRMLWESGSATMILPRQHRLAREIDKRWLMIPPDDSGNAYIVRQKHLQKDGRAEGRMEISAPGMASQFANPGRIVVPASGSHDQQNDVAAEAAMKHYVNNHAGPGATANRQLPGLMIASNQDRGADITFHARFESVLEVISDIGKAGGLGYEIIYDPDDDEFIFDVIEGTDRTATVFFDLEFESIQSLSWLRTELNRSTFAYVGGEGDGASRTVETVWLSDSEPSGFDRRETFVDERRVDETDALRDAGRATLEDSRSEDTVEVQLNPFGSFRYPADFDLGDLVTVRDQEFGLETEARIVGIEQVITGNTMIPQTTISIGNPWPDVELRVDEELQKRPRKHS